MLQPSYSVRPAEKEDLPALSAFIDSEGFVHRHLDWKAPLDWLGEQPFWILERNNEIAAVLACPADPENICWIRLFAVKSDLAPSKAWQVLFDKCLDDFVPSEKKFIFASVVLKEWFIKVLKQTNFIHHQEIVVLEWNNDLPRALPTADGLIIRPMRPEDLPAVAVVDRRSFAQLWQNSEESLRLAFQRNGISTVALLNEQIIGYQISTTNLMNTHLARLAVIPDLQHKNIGYALVRDLLSRALQSRSWQVTVNTQHDNSASLALYQKMGFYKTGDHFPVYIYIKA
jgi:ribosomal protein S18 acetylase RimI-like enzyme